MFPSAVGSTSAVVFEALNAQATKMGLSLPDFDEIAKDPKPCGKEIERQTLTRYPECSGVKQLGAKAVYSAHGN